jgi:hypothetical protein
VAGGCLGAGGVAVAGGGAAVAVAGWCLGAAGLAWGWVASGSRCCSAVRGQPGSRWPRLGMGLSGSPGLPEYGVPGAGWPAGCLLPGWPGGEGRALSGGAAVGGWEPGMAGCGWECSVWRTAVAADCCAVPVRGYVGFIWIWDLGVGQAEFCLLGCLLSVISGFSVL